MRGMGGRRKRCKRRGRRRRGRRGRRVVLKQYKRFTRLRKPSSRHPRREQHASHPTAHYLELPTCLLHLPLPPPPHPLARLSIGCHCIEPCLLSLLTVALSAYSFRQYIGRGSLEWFIFFKVISDICSLGLNHLNLHPKRSEEISDL